MMPLTRNVVVFAFLLAQLAPSLATAVEVEPLPRSESGVIGALLRTTTLESKRSLEARGTCQFGYVACDDGLGCCSIGTVCGTWGGKPGCCPVGKTCVANDNPCIYVGDVKCKGENFCCPAGDTCYRDSAGKPKCSYNPGGFTTTKSTTRTATTSYTPPAASATFSTPTFSFAAPTFTTSSSSSIPAATFGGTFGDETFTTGGTLPSNGANPFGATQGGGALANTVAGSSIFVILAGIAAVFVAA